MSRLETLWQKIIDRRRPLPKPITPNPEPIATPAIREIMPPMHSIISELREAFQNGEYGILIGDDTSGRIPTLILRGVINHINRDHARPPITTIFIRVYQQELSPSDTQRLKRNLQPLKDLPNGGKALIVSECLATGNHVKKIGDIVDEMEIPYDIATTGILTDFKQNNTLRTRNIFPKNGYLKRKPLIHNAPQLTGLSRYYKETHAYRGPIDKVITARRDVRTAVTQLTSN